MEEGIIEEARQELRERYEERGEAPRQQFDYYDEKGELICSAVIEFEKFRDEAGKRVRSLVLKGELDGRPTEVDLMEMTDAIKNEVSMVMSKERLPNYHYNSVDKITFVPPLETALDLAVALHELGHAGQFHDERFAPLNKLYGLEKREKPLLDKIATVRATIPEIQEFITEKDLVMISSMSDTISQRNIELMKLNSRANVLQTQETTNRFLYIDDLLDSRLEELTSLYEEAYSRLRSIPKDAPEYKDTEKNEIAKLIKKMEKMGFIFAKKQEDPSISDTPFLSKDDITSIEWVNKLTQITFSSYYILGDKYLDSEKKLTSFHRLTSPDRETILVIVASRVSKEKYEKYAAEQKNLERDINKIKQEKLVIEEEKKRLQIAKENIMDSLHIKDLPALPTRMMERDATRRAFQWMRELRQKYGIDLFKSVRVKQGEHLPEIRRIEEECETSITAGLKEGEEKIIRTDAKRDLSIALKTYRAGTKEMLKKYKRRIPRVRGKSAP